MTSIKEKYDTALNQLMQPGSPFELGSDIIGNIQYKVFTNAPKTIPELLAPAWEHGEEEFIIYEGERWTFDQFMQQASSIGYQLQNKFGIQRGDRVAIAMRNYPEWMSAFVGIVSIGATAVPLNSWGQAKELEYGLTDAGVKAAFLDQQRLDYITPRLDDLGIQVIAVRPEKTELPEHCISLPDFISGAETATMPKVEISPDDSAIIMYTSGTTGNPKGAVSTHFSVCQAATNFECTGAAFAMSCPDIIGKAMEKGFAPSQMLAVPLFHVSGCHAVFLLALRGARKLVVMYKWNAEKALETIEKERITILSAAPTMLMQMLESPAFDKFDTSSLFSVGGGGSATPPKAVKLIYDKVDPAFAGTGWGMTETNATGTAFTGHGFQNNPRSSGFANPICEIKVLDDEGNELPTGVAGNLWIKTPAMIKEYWHRPEANAKDFKEGWFDTGDIGYFDEEGYIYLSDRAKDMIIRGGENIYPAEIEAVLFDHPAVEEASVFGVPDETMGELVAAVVKVHQGQTTTEDEIKAFASEHLARFKVPAFVKIKTEDMPKNASGKILKKDLRQALIDELKAGQ